jgi:hypothetical protein
MNKMTGIALMMVGVFFFTFGIKKFTSKNEIREEPANTKIELEKIIEMAIADGVLTQNEKKVIEQFTTDNELDYKEIMKDIESRISTLGTDSETELIDYKKRNGDDFEKFVIQKFKKRYFTIKEWAGDKYIDGVYAQTTTQPDILFGFKIREKSTELAVECKWRKKYYKNGIELGKKDQLERYKAFQKDKNIPVFIAIGVGGKGKSPEQIYIVPLQNIENNFIPMTELKKYEKVIDRDFFFDIETNELK